MKEIKELILNKKSLIVIATIYWMASLARTDSYYIIYLLIGLCSFIKRKESNIHKWQKNVTIIFSIIFSLFVSLANYELFFSTFDRYAVSDSLRMLAAIVLMLLTFITGVIVFKRVLLLLYVNLVNIKDIIFEKESKNRFSPKKIFTITFASLLVVDLFMLFFVQFPGILTNDSMNQIEEIITGKYSNMNPYWHTMVVRFFYNLGLSIFKTPNAGVATYLVFQITVLALVVAFTNKTLSELKIKKGLNILLILFFTIVPFNLYYSVTLWKDILFGIMALLMITSSARIISGIGNKYVNYILLFIGGFGFCVLRNNGWYAIVASTIVFIFLFAKNKKGFIIIFVIISIVSFLFTHTYIASKNIGESELIESLAIPIQQVSRVIRDCDDLTKDEIRQINKVVDVKKVASAYVPYICDDVKSVIRESGNQQYLIENINDYASLYIKLGLRHPLKYIAAWIDQTKGYFNGGYNYWIVSFVVNDNKFGIEQNIILKPVSALLSYYELAYREINLLQPIVSIGLHFWYMLIVLYIGIMKKCTNICYLTIPLIMMIGTLLIATPVYAEFRYAYPLFTCSYFIIIYALSETKNEES